MDYKIEEKLPRGVVPCELKAHNIKAYNEAVEMIKKHGRAAVVEPTGTGKSYVAMKIMQDMASKNKLILGPSIAALKELKTKPEWVNHNTMTCNYASVEALKTELEKSTVSIDLIVLDELHRCGARIWGQGVLGLIGMYPNAIVLGLTATPVRYLDFQRDMVDEMFNGESAGNLTLSDAIEQGILPAPIYVTAMYDIKSDTRTRLMMAASSESQKRRINQIMQEYRAGHNSEEVIVGALKKHIGDCDNRNWKHIIFVSRTSVADTMKESVQLWFKQVYPDRRINVYVVHSKAKDKELEMSSFCTNHSKNTVDVLISVNMANESFHIDNTKSIIMLRSTSSPILYMQQMGRALAAGGEEPIIFDFVDNLEALGNITVFVGNMQYKANKRTLYASSKTGKVFKEFDDYTKDFSDVIDKVDSILGNDWTASFIKLDALLKNNGFNRLHDLYKVDEDVYDWSQKQQKLFLGGHLRPDRHEMFSTLGHTAYATKNMSDCTEKWFIAVDAMAAAQDGEDTSRFNIKESAIKKAIADTKSMLIANTLPTGGRMYLESKQVEVVVTNADIIDTAKKMDIKGTNAYTKAISFVLGNSKQIDINSPEFDKNTYFEAISVLHPILGKILGNRTEGVYECLYYHWMHIRDEINKVIEIEPEILHGHLMLLLISMEYKGVISEQEDSELNKCLMEIELGQTQESTLALAERLSLTDKEDIRKAVTARTPFGRAYKVLKEKDSKQRNKRSKAGIEAQELMQRYSKMFLSQVYQEMMQDIGDTSMIDPLYYRIKGLTLDTLEDEKINLIGMLYSAMGGNAAAVNTIKLLNDTTKISERCCLRILLGEDGYALMNNADKDLNKVDGRTQLVEKWIHACNKDEQLGYPAKRLGESGLFEAGKKATKLIALDETADETAEFIKENKSFMASFSRGKKRAEELIALGLKPHEIIDINVVRWIKDTKLLFGAGVATKNHIDIIRSMGFSI